MMFYFVTTIRDCINVVSYTYLNQLLAGSIFSKINFFNIFYIYATQLLCACESSKQQFVALKSAGNNTSTVAATTNSSRNTSLMGVDSGGDGGGDGGGIDGVGGLFTVATMKHDYTSTICMAFPSYFSNYSVLLLISTAVITQLSHVCKICLMVFIAGMCLCGVVVKYLQTNDCYRFIYWLQGEQFFFYLLLMMVRKSICLLKFK